MFRKSITLVLIMNCLALFAQTNEANKFDFNYLLVGEAKSIRIEIDLNSFQTNYYPYLYDKNDFTKSCNDEGFLNISRVAFTPVKVKIINNSSSSINLNSAYDTLIISNGNSQLEYNYQLLLSDYPSKILKNNSATIIYSNPYEATTSMTGIYGVEPFIISTSIFQCDSSLNSIYLQKIKSSNTTIKEESSQIDFNDINSRLIGNLLFGEFELGTERIKIPLNLELSNAEK